MNKIFQAIKISAAAQKVSYALELLQMEGIDSLKDYFEKLKKQKERTKSAKLLFDIPEFTFAYTKTFEIKEEHPKYEKLKELVEKEDLKKTKISELILALRNIY